MTAKAQELPPPLTGWLPRSDWGCPSGQRAAADADRPALVETAEDLDELDEVEDE